MAGKSGGFGNQHELAARTRFAKNERISRHCFQQCLKFLFNKNNLLIEPFLKVQNGRECV
jgi:hypothetical protein